MSLWRIESWFESKSRNFEPKPSARTVFRFKLGRWDLNPFTRFVNPESSKDTRLSKSRNLRQSVAEDSGYNRIMSFFVYILECSDKTYYVGCTNNLEKRFKQHNESKLGAHYTKIRRPVTLKHSEQFVTLLEARRREFEIKSWRREEKRSLWSDT